MGIRMLGRYVPDNYILQPTKMAGYRQPTSNNQLIDQASKELAITNSSGYTFRLLGMLCTSVDYYVGGAVAPDIRNIKYREIQRIYLGLKKHQKIGQQLG